MHFQSPRLFADKEATRLMTAYRAFAVCDLLGDFFAPIAGVFVSSDSVSRAGRLPRMRLR